MADTKSLWIAGLILGALTAAVVLLAGAVVHAHVDGRLSLDGVPRQIAVAPTSIPTR
jgi:hypothetical protein